MITKINHVAVVVEDMATARQFWEEALGLKVTATDRVDAQEVDIAFLPVGESEVELLRPFTPDSGVAKYLAKRGPGIHHICFEVDNITTMLDHLSKNHIPLIDETPRISRDGTQYAFVHPKGTGGVLVELYQLPETPITSPE